MVIIILSSVLCWRTVAVNTISKVLSSKGSEVPSILTNSTKSLLLDLANLIISADISAPTRRAVFSCDSSFRLPPGPLPISKTDFPSKLTAFSISRKR